MLVHDCYTHIGRAEPDLTMVPRLMLYRCQRMSCSAIAQCSKLQSLNLLHQRSLTLEGLQTLSSLTEPSGARPRAHAPLPVTRAQRS